MLSEAGKGWSPHQSPAQGSMSPEPRSDQLTEPGTSWSSPSRVAFDRSFQERRLTLAPGIPAPHPPQPKYWATSEKQHMRGLDRSPPLNSAEIEIGNSTSSSENMPTFRTAFATRTWHEPWYRTAVANFRKWITVPFTRKSSIKHS